MECLLYSNKPSTFLFSISFFPLVGGALLTNAVAAFFDWSVAGTRNQEYTTHTSYKHLTASLLKSLYTEVLMQKFLKIIVLGFGCTLCLLPWSWNLNYFFQVLLNLILMHWYSAGSESGFQLWKCRTSPILCINRTMQIASPSKVIAEKWRSNGTKCHFFKNMKSQFFSNHTTNSISLSIWNNSPLKTWQEEKEYVFAGKEILMKTHSVEIK